MGETKGETFLYLCKTKKLHLLYYLIDIQHIIYFKNIVKIVFFPMFESRPDRKRFVKDTSYMAVGNRDPRDVSTILRVLFFMGVLCADEKPRLEPYTDFIFFRSY
jgi:hypothetical protein